MAHWARLTPGSWLMILASSLVWKSSAGPERIRCRVSGGVVQMGLDLVISRSSRVVRALRSTIEEKRLAAPMGPCQAIARPSETNSPTARR